MVLVDESGQLSDLPRSLVIGKAPVGGPELSRARVSCARRSEPLTARTADGQLETSERGRQNQEKFPFLTVPRVPRRFRKGWRVGRVLNV